MKEMKKNMNNRTAQGFSLIELMVTMAIFGILILSAVPATSQWRLEKRVSSISSALAADLAQARMLAIMRNAPVIVSFDPTHEDYAIFIDSDGNGSESEERHKYISLNSLDAVVTFGVNGGVGIDGDAIPRAVDIGQSTFPIQLTFYPNGAVNNAGTVYLIPQNDLGSRSDRQRAVNITNTGRISKWKFDPSAGTIPWREKI